LNFLRKKYSFPDVIFLPYTEGTSIALKLPSEVIKDHNQYMFFISRENEIYKGYFAFKKLAESEIKLVFFARFMSFRIIEMLGKFIYNLVARNRSRLSGVNPKCGIE
jgi:predicted DCC family thiol-disulfide oxidoreductase YuxK